MKKKVVYKGREYIIETKNNDLFRNGEKFTTKISYDSGNLYKVTVDDTNFNIEIRENKMFVDGEEVQYSVKPYFPLLKKQKETMNLKRVHVKEPIPGTILQIFVENGESVEKDQEIIILEAMKMRNRILAPIDGQIREIRIKEGDSVSQDQILVLIEN